MREWINLFERKTDGVWKNPTTKELSTLVVDQDMRGIGVGNDVYIDYAFEDTHHGMRVRLGLPDPYAGDEAVSGTFDFYVCNSKSLYDEYEGDKDVDFQNNMGGREDWVWGSQEPAFSTPGFYVFTNCEEGEALSNKGFARLVTEK